MGDTILQATDGKLAQAQPRDGLLVERPGLVQDHYLEVEQLGLVREKTQIAHGFPAGGGLALGVQAPETYVLADAVAGIRAVAWLLEAPDVDTLRLAFGGVQVQAAHGFTVGLQHYLSTGGTISTSLPTSGALVQPILVPINSGEVRVEMLPLMAETSLGDLVVLKERAEPPDPTVDGSSVGWLSNGTGMGEAGDILFKVRVGGVTKSFRLVLYNL